MKKRVLYLLFIVLALQLTFCTQKEKEGGKILAQINDYKLILNEFQAQLAQELELEVDFKLTREAKKEFLEELIRKELLIQEAKRLELDRKEKFVQAIQRYWESTLIRDLMELKGREIDHTTLVTQEEIQSRYEQVDPADKKIVPVEELQNQIAKKLKGEKKAHRFQIWIDELREKADIKINLELL